MLQQSKALCGQKVYLDDDLTPYQCSMPAKLSIVFNLQETSFLEAGAPFNRV